MALKVIVILAIGGIGAIMAQFMPLGVHPFVAFLVSAAAASVTAVIYA